MAHKRMFSKDITGSDAFLEMPASSQALYFHLGMEADDDGFIGNPKKIMRVMGVSDDDFKILLAKRFLLSFPSGIVVVKHHRINNNWDKHNCKRTIYLEEFSSLRIKENRAYTLDETQGLPLQSDSRLNPVFRIEENRIDKNTVGANAPRFSGEGEEETRPTKLPKDERALSLCAWAEKRRGFPFTSNAAQLGAIGRAKRAKVSPARLKERWIELEGETWRNGFDWVDVVKSFDKRA